MAFTTTEWAFVFGVLGNIISFCVFLSPLPTFYMIYKKKSTEGFQSIPYIVGLFSAMLWIYYAYLKPGNTLLVTINSFGIFIEVLYIGFYLFYGTKQARLDTFKMLMVLIVIGFGLIVTLTHFFAKGVARTVIVGWICLVFSLCVFVAPLGIVRKVIKTKSVEYMPISLSAFLTMSAVVWFFYGLLKKDVNIAVPNILGFLFGVVQMVLYQIYNKHEKSIKCQNQKLQDAVKDQIIIVDEDMLTSDNNNNNNNKKPPPNQQQKNATDQAIENKFEKIPVVLCRVDDAIDDDDQNAPKMHCIQMESKPPMIAVRV